MEHLESDSPTGAGNSKKLSLELQEKNSVLDNSINKTFSLQGEVITRKNQAFKIRCESAVTSTGLSKEQFYSKSNIPRQLWYYWSWGLIKFPDYIKIRLCDLFGKSFRDLFLEDKR
jgi:hypothetical protein